MQPMNLLEMAWRLALAGTIALLPGMVFWTLVLCLYRIVRHLNRRRRVPAPASGAVQL